MGKKIYIVHKLRIFVNNLYLTLRLNFVTMSGLNKMGRQVRDRKKFDVYSRLDR